jgi:hypothetical protein
MMIHRTAPLLALLVLACAGAPQTRSPAPVAANARAVSAPARLPPDLTARVVPLPGAKAPVTLDLVAYDRSSGRVWVPVGDTASVDVFQIATGTFRRVDGFKAVRREMHGHQRAMGPSSVTIGDGVAYVGTRSTSEVCAVDEASLTRGRCLALAASPDFVTFVAPAREVWVTLPRKQSIAVLDATNPGDLRPKLVIEAPGSVEGAAVDAVHGLYYTNLEDQNKTLGIDIGSHTIKSTWTAGCGEGGPHGIAVDPSRRFVFVACSNGVRILDAAHNGATLGTIEAGDGVDDIAYDADKHLLYVAAARSHRLTIARVDAKAGSTVIATGSTSQRGRNAVGDADGNIYVADAGSAALLVFAAPAK